MRYSTEWEVCLVFKGVPCILEVIVVGNSIKTLDHVSEKFILLL